jgi:hypothetical protein
MADLCFSLTKILSKLTVGGILSLLSSRILPIVFLSVPAMVIRCVRKNSFFTALNIFSNIKFILKHLGDYTIAWVSVFVMLALFSSIAGTIVSLRQNGVGTGFVRADAILLKGHYRRGRQRYREKCSVFPFAFFRVTLADLTLPFSPANLERQSLALTRSRGIFHNASVPALQQSSCESRLAYE